MAKSTKLEPAHPLATFDEFVDAVPWGESRTVLVYRRKHSWREYVRLRTWDRHREKGCWYPSRRFFTIPLERAEDLAWAIISACAGDQFEKPDWLVAREQNEDEQLRRMLGAEESMTAEEIEKLKRETAKAQR